MGNIPKRSDAFQNKNSRQRQVSPPTREDHCEGSEQEVEIWQKDNSEVRKMCHTISLMVLFDSVDVDLMSKVPMPAPPACIVEFDQFSVTVTEAECSWWKLKLLPHTSRVLASLMLFRRDCVGFSCHMGERQCGTHCAKISFRLMLWSVLQ